MFMKLGIFGIRSMKFKRAFQSAFACAAVLFLAGCQELGPASATKLPAIGPVSGTPFRPKARSVPGQLIVYTETFASDQGHIRTEPHREYRILDESGTFVRRVLNHTLLSDENPEIVELPPGKYRVVGRGAGLGIAEVPVLIAPSEVTEVYLDAAGMKHPPKRDDSTWIRLPDGRVVGRKAIGY